MRQHSLARLGVWGVRSCCFLGCYVAAALLLDDAGVIAAPASTTSAAELQYRSLAESFIRSHFGFRPLEAVALGLHQYDGAIMVPSKVVLAAEAERLRRFDAEFIRVDETKLTPENRLDLLRIRSAIAGQRWILETQRAPARNPMFYAGALDISVYLKRDFKPFEQRLQDITTILRQTRAIFAAARRNLDPVLPKPFVETAVEVAQGTAAFLAHDVTQAAQTVTNAPVRNAFLEACSSATNELGTFVEWLKTEKLPKADASFALGHEAYVAMLKAELIDLTPERILEIGRHELRAEQERFAKAARLIDTTQKPEAVFKAIQRDHPTATNLISDTRKNLESIRQFLVDRRIITIPSETRPRVEETLPPFRATSFASMDTPGPFESRATEAYYYVTPVEPDWSPTQAEEWLTAFNYYTTDVVSIHEVYPGHYLNFLALKASPAGPIAKTFTSYPFVEGWAHYTEQMMIEEGFGQPDRPASASRDEIVRGAKYQLAQSDEALLRLCRLCASIELHTKGMTVEDATRFFMGNCYYEEKPARQEAIRGTFDPGYLYYTLGKLMILKLRQDWQTQEGAHSSLQRFHDAFLSHGAPPLRLMREILLRDPKLWGTAL